MFCSTIHSKKVGFAAHRQDQVIVREALAAHPHLVLGEINPSHLAHQKADVGILVQDAPHRVDDVFRFELGGCHLVEQGEERCGNYSGPPPTHPPVPAPMPGQPTNRQNLLRRSPLLGDASPPYQPPGFSFFSR